jgi:hypothetical protein
MPVMLGGSMIVAGGIIVAVAANSGSTRPVQERCRQRPGMTKEMERETGIEPATSSLGSWRSTAELLPLDAAARKW